MLKEKGTRVRKLAEQNACTLLVLSICFVITWCLQVIGIFK